MVLLVLRALPVLGLVTLLQASSSGPAGPAVSLRVGPGARQRGRTVRLILDPSVQPLTVSSSVSSMANMSLSPWTYRDSCEVSRVPRRISHAQCLTSGCLSLPGAAEDAALEARPIYYQVLVLHRVLRRSSTAGRKRRRRYDFRLGTEVIPVGCTCVRPSVAPQH